MEVIKNANIIFVGVDVEQQTPLFDLALDIGCDQFEVEYLDEGVELVFVSLQEAQRFHRVLKIVNELYS